MIFQLLGWLIFGLIIGTIAKFFTPGNDPKGWFKTICIGVVGSYFGGIIKLIITGFDGDFSPSGFIFSLIGSIVFLIIWRKIDARRNS